MYLHAPVETPPPPALRSPSRAGSPRQIIDDSVVRTRCLPGVVVGYAPPRSSCMMFVRLKIGLPYCLMLASCPGHSSLPQGKEGANIIFGTGSSSCYFTGGVILRISSLSEAWDHPLSLVIRLLSQLLPMHCQNPNALLIDSVNLIIMKATDDSSNSTFVTRVCRVNQSGTNIPSPPTP